MNTWNLVGAGKLECTESPLPESGAGKVRVRISKVLVNDMDVALYTGSVRHAYPLVPGRYAVGIVAEDNDNALFPKGTRVLPHVYRPADESGTARRDFSLPDYDVCGWTTDGFLRDFVLLSPEDMTPLPPSVGDNDALFLHHLALAKAVCDRLDASKGDHIAVIGANVIGIFVCQLLIYQQAAPILIDADEEKLAFARSCGIYYTMAADEKLLDSVASVTGGRLVNGSVYLASCVANPPETAFSVCGTDGNVVIAGSSLSNVNANLSLALRKHLNIHCVNNGAEYIETAINLAANRAVDLTAFRAVEASPEEAGSLFARGAEQTSGNVSEFRLIRLL